MLCVKTEKGLDAPGLKDSDPESTTDKKVHALIAFLTLNENTLLRVWRWESVVTVCLSVSFVWFGSVCAVVFVWIWCCAIRKPIPATKKTNRINFIIKPDAVNHRSVVLGWESKNTNQET